VANAFKQLKYCYEIHFFILIYALSLSVEYNQQIDPFLSTHFLFWACLGSKNRYGSCVGDSYKKLIRR